MNLHSKKDFQDCMLSILNPLKPYYSEEKARLTLGVTMAHYDIGATWMEAFSRPLWGLVPFWAGGGKEPEFEEIYRKGLTAGTDEKNPEYWGECTSFDQRFVEMAAISYGIIFENYTRRNANRSHQKCAEPKDNHRRNHCRSQGNQNVPHDRAGGCAVPNMRRWRYDQFVTQSNSPQTIFLERSSSLPAC